LHRIGLIVVVALAVALGLLVGTLNHEMTSVDLLWVQLDWPLGLLLLATLTVGLFIGLLLAWLFRILPLRMQLRKTRRVDASGSGYPGTTT
jgi:uncharacterized integral membrane protein